MNVLITGCSSGFGMLAALECARRGDTVYATVRESSRAAELLERGDGLSIEVVELDVTDPASVRTAVDGVLARAGHLDALVNNAGIGQLGPLEEFSDDEVRALFETNVMGLIRVTQAVLPGMRERGSGTIVNVSSLGGLVAPPFFAVYSASKFAVEGVTEALGAELRPFGIRVISVAPAGYDTPILVKGDVPPAGHTPDSPYAAEFQTVRATHIAGMKERDNPEEVATAIADAIHDPAFPARKVLPESMSFVDTSRGQTPAEDVRTMLRASYGLA